jgi:hypothetical protein
MGSNNDQLKHISNDELRNIIKALLPSTNDKSLAYLIDEIATQAKERGLTEEILKRILAEEDEKDGD